MPKYYLDYRLLGQVKLSSILVIILYRLIFAFETKIH